MACKIKNLNFNREGFGDRGKQKRSLISTLKKNFQPLASCFMELPNLNDFADVLKTIAPNSIVHAAVKQQEIDFEVQSVTLECNIKSFTNVSDIIEMSGSNSSFFENLKTLMTSENIKIEAQTRGQNQNRLWYACRKGVITASKAHEVFTKMKKVIKWTGGYVNLWALNQKISGLTFVNPNIPSLKYGRDMEPGAINTFADIMKKNS